MKYGRPDNKRSHRGSGSTRQLKIYLNNVNGLAPRADSLKDILERLQSDIVVLCETKATNSFVESFFKNIKYVPVIKNRVSPNSGGIVIAVRDFLSQCFTESTCSMHDNICSAVLKSENQNLKIIAAYGPQETVKREEREAFYDELAIEVESGYEHDCSPLILGDLNAKIITDNLGNIEALSPNGELLSTFITDHNLFAVNHLDKCTGLWTRQNRCNTEERSVLDYILMHESMGEKVTEAAIDEDLFVTPFNVKKVKGGGMLVKYTDHNALTLQLSDVFKKPKLVAEKLAGWWKLNEEGLLRLSVMTDHQGSFFHDHSKGVQENFDSMSSTLESVMSECFKKVHPSKKRGPSSQSNILKTQKILHEIAKEGKVQRQVAYYYLKLL